VSPFSDLDALSEPVSYLLSKVVAVFDPRDPRTVGAVDLGLDVDDEAESLVGSFRGSVVHAEGSALLAVFATPVEGVRCALELSERSWLRARSAGGGLHSGLMSERRHDLAEHVTRAAAQLADLAVPGQLLITGAVMDGVISDDRIEAVFVETVPLDGQVMGVFEARRATGADRP
jgi:class 3 adenylate cyclase